MITEAMGIGGNFWDLLKPYARFEGFDFLRDRRVAVDLSYWIVQHETAIKGYCRNPHIRLTFFRTVNLFSKFGAYPVFVLDGTPSPLKSQARIARFFKSSGIDSSSYPEPVEGISVERNRSFRKYVEECAELVQLLGLPILKAKGEAEGLCAQLNREGYVDACITADSDAFLYGALCVIKRILPIAKEPFECYHIHDIDAGLGLKRNHLIAVSLLVGSDHDLSGVRGIGVETAVRFVKSFSEDGILDRLHKLDQKLDQSDLRSILGCNDTGGETACSFNDKSLKLKIPHCSHCGHPGNKKSHLKFSCEYCNSYSGQNCRQKAAGFRCYCSSCELDRKEKDKKKDNTWRITVCRKIASVQNFPNDEIIKMYLSEHHGIDEEPIIGWGSPQTEMLVDYLIYKQNWEPSYIRERLLPMLSTIYLRNMVSSPTANLLHGQYEFHSIHRVKIRHGNKFYVVKWKKASPVSSDAVPKIREERGTNQQSAELDESLDLLEEVDVPYFHIDNGWCFLLTDENIDLVQKAFPEKASDFLKKQEQKENKSRKRKSKSGCEGTPEITDSPASRDVQLSITEFYRSSKVVSTNKPEKSAGNEDNSPLTKRSDASQRLSKSVRRRLLFG